MQPLAQKKASSTSFPGLDCVKEKFGIDRE
jgi:hypothetical protein